MQAVISKIHGGLAWITLAAVVAQFFLAGLGVFGAESFAPHKALGNTIGAASLILLLLALAGRLGRARIGLSAALFGLMIVQMLLVSSLVSSQPWVEALHPVNALLILGASAQLARRGFARGPSNVTEPRLAGEPSAH